MVTDIKMYFEMYQEEPVFRTLELTPLIKKAVEVLSGNGKFAAVRLETAISPDAASIRADARDMERMFFHLLQNSFEAADPKDPRVRISSRIVQEPHPGILMEIFNTGTPIKEDELDQFASPFFSTKPGSRSWRASSSARTGFGSRTPDPTALSAHATSCSSRQRRKTGSRTSSEPWTMRTS